MIIDGGRINDDEAARVRSSGVGNGPEIKTNDVVRGRYIIIFTSRASVANASLRSSVVDKSYIETIIAAI